MESDTTEWISEWKWRILMFPLLMITAAGLLLILRIFPCSPVVALVVVMIAKATGVSDRRTGDYGNDVLRNKAVLVTGCDTGFGHELAIQLSEMGVQTFAGCLFSTGIGARRLKERANNKYLHVIQMDVTKDGEVEEAVAYVRSKLEENRFWGVVNNAGLNFLGDVELTTMAQYEKCVQINQLGMIRVTKAFLPLIRAAQGRVVNVTSGKGLFSKPLNAAYASTKFAAEAFSDSLRREMRDFGVKVAIIQPYNFGGATDAVNPERMKRDFATMWENATEEVRETYGREYLEQHEMLVEAAVPSACTELGRVTGAIVHALFATAPKTRYLINGSSGWCDIYWIRGKLVHYLPASWFDAWLRRDWKRHVRPKAVMSK